MRKWRDMERQMAPRSQTFSQGGIRSSDWFSDRLETDSDAVRSHTSPPQVQMQPFIRLPVQSVAHLYGDKHRQRHGHRVWRLEHVAVQALELGVVWGALEEVALRREGQDVGSGWRQWVEAVGEGGELTSWYKVTWGPSSEIVNHQAAAPTVAAPT